MPIVHGFRKPQLVRLWNPWQDNPKFDSGTPTEVPMGWRVLGLADKNIVLVSDDEADESAQRTYTYKEGESMRVRAGRAIQWTSPPSGLEMTRIPAQIVPPDDTPEA